MVELLICDFCETPVLGATVCDTCKLLHDHEVTRIRDKKLDTFYPLLEAAKMALDNLSHIATHETIGSMAYQETRMKLLLVIEKFEND